MKPTALAACLLLVLGCRPAARSSSVNPFPEPPQQQSQWDAPAETNELVSAATTLFSQGLADPRGYDYREVELEIGEIWNGTARKFRTHAWVLPSNSNSNTFAVCWNGLVYPVSFVGDKTSVENDVESILQSAKTNSGQMRMTLYGRAISEQLSVAETSALPIKSCLLLRIGKTDLAFQLLDTSNKAQENARQSQTAKDPYLMLAGDWAWSIFDRMICAHNRGDVRMALISARLLASIQPQIEAEAKRRGFPRPAKYESLQKPKEQPYLTFLDQLSQVLSDLERRAREPKEKSVVESGLTNHVKQAERIAALIDDLDLVNARQSGQPGFVPLQTDPIVMALIAEGTPAVEPLLDCWQKDKRLTRSVGFHRDFFRDRHVLTVASAAKAALQEILQTQFQNSAEARAFWKNYKGLSPEERWFQILRDESIAESRPIQVRTADGKSRSETMLEFGRGQWMEAARMIIQPNNITGVPGSGFHTENPSIAQKDAKFRGESLRSKRNPSVTELLVKQANFVAEKAEHLDQAQGVDAIRAGTEVASIINKWEERAAGPPAKILMHRAIALWSDPHSFIMSSGHELARYIPNLTLVRVEAGDTNALEDFASWIKSAELEKIDSYAMDAFEPLWRNPGDSNVSKVSEWLFNDPLSPWSKLPWQRSGLRNPIESDLMKLPQFRKLLARELDDLSVIGTIQWSQPNNIRYEIKNQGGGSRGAISWPEGEVPANGTKVDLRQCDWISWSLSNSKKIPFFNPFAPVEKRDQSIKAAKRELQKSE